MPYNFKKASQEPYSKMLEKNVKDYGLDKNDPKLYEKMLKDERDGQTGPDSIITEKQLNKEHKESNYSITEKQLNNGSTELNEFSKGFRNDKGSHPMDYFKEGEKAEKKAYNAAQDKKRDKRKMDEIAGDQMVGEKTTIVNNKYKSQLLSNYDSREDFLKKNKMAKKASSDLFEADAYLFAIYKTANEEKRDLTDIEKAAVDSVTDAKIKIIAQLDNFFSPEFQNQQRLEEQGEIDAERELELSQLPSLFDEENQNLNKELPPVQDSFNENYLLPEDPSELDSEDENLDRIDMEDNEDRLLMDEEEEFLNEEEDFYNEIGELGLDDGSPYDEENFGFASSNNVDQLIKTAKKEIDENGTDYELSLKIANAFIKKLVDDFGYKLRDAEEMLMKEILND